MTYQWGVGHVPLIKQHSINKLRLVRNYFNFYLKIVGKGGFKRSTFPLCFVDGFCGGGKYETKDGVVVDGSPFQALEAAIEFELSVNIPTPKTRNRFLFLFIDENRQTVDFLKAEVEKWRQLNSLPADWEFHFWCGSFSNLCGRAIELCRRHSTSERAIFFLDQYGYAAVRIQDILRIMTGLRHSEVVFTFSTDWLIDKAPRTELERKLKDMGCLPRSVDSFASKIDNMSSERGETAAQSKRRICQKFFVKEIVENFPSDHRPYFSPYIYRSKESNKNHAILHLSWSLKAKEVMTGVQWDLADDMLHEGPGGLNAHISYGEGRTFFFDDPSVDRTMPDLKEQLLRRVQDLGPIPAGVLYAKVVDSTPMTKEHIYDALEELRKEGRISATTAQGNSSQRIKDDTVVKIARHTHLWLP